MADKEHLKEKDYKPPTVREYYEEEVKRRRTARTKKAVKDTIRQKGRH